MFSYIIENAQEKKNSSIWFCMPKNTKEGKNIFYYLPTFFLKKEKFK